MVNWNILILVDLKTVCPNKFTLLVIRDAPVRSDWVPVGLGIQSDWVPVRLGIQSDWVLSPDWYPVRLGTQSRLGDRSDWVSFTYKYLIS